MLDEWKGKRVLITGASRGIGAAVAKQLGALGAHVAVHYHSSDAPAEAVVKAINEAGGEAFTLKADVSQSSETKRLVDNAAERLGGLDVLINNAGDMLGRVGLAEMDDDQYDRVMDLNVRSVVMASRAALPHFQRAGAVILFTPPRLLRVTAVGRCRPVCLGEGLCEHHNAQYGQGVGRG